MTHDNNHQAESYRQENGQFAKGNPGKPKGSSKNKLRDRIRTFLNDNFDNLPEWFESLKPKEKVDAYLSLMPYAVSRLQSISMTDVEANGFEPKPEIDYTKLSEGALREILEHTTLENEKNIKAS